MVSFSIIIETENLGMAGLDDLKKCLDSLDAQEYSVMHAEEVIIISGAQLSEEHHENLSRRYPWANIHQVGRSINYIEAKSLGATLVTSDIVVYADADVIYTQTWLGSLLEPFVDDRYDITAGYTRIQEGRSLIGKIYTMALSLTWMLHIEKEVQVPTLATNFSFNNMAVKRNVVLDFPMQYDLPVYRGAISIWKKVLAKYNVEIYRVPHARGYHAAPPSIMDWVYRMMIMGSDPVSLAHIQDYNKLIQIAAFTKWMLWKIKKTGIVALVLLREDWKNVLLIVLSIPIVILHFVLFFVSGVFTLISIKSVYTWITKRETMHIV